MSALPKGLPLLAVLLLSAPVVALAQPESPPPTPPADETEESRKQRARLLYVEAFEHHQAGNYIEAAEKYLAAHAIYPKPALLYNAAQVYRLGKEREKAIALYENYLELEPEGEGADNAREFIAALEAELAQAKSPDPIEPEPEPPSAPPTGSVTGDLGSRTVGGAVISPDPTPVVSKDLVAGRGRGKRIVGLVLVGAGVAAAGAGVAFGLHARNLADEASEFTGPFNAELDDLYDRGETADRNMLVLLSAGAVTTVSGAVIYFLGTRDRRRAERDLTLIVTPSSIGMSFAFE